MAKTKSGTKFKWPIFDMVVAPFAFAAWGFASPDAPLKSIIGYDIKWNTAIITVTAVGVTLLANALHKFPDYDQVVTQQQGAVPKTSSP